MAFDSYATNLDVPYNENRQVLFDPDPTKHGDLVLISQVTDSSTPGVGDSYNPSISTEGNVVAFTSEASLGRNNIQIEHSQIWKDLDPDDPSAGLEIVSGSMGAGGNVDKVGNGNSNNPSVDYSGNYIAFDTSATNLGVDLGNGGSTGVVVDNLGTIKLVSNDEGSYGTLSGGNAEDPSIGGRTLDDQIVAYVADPLAVSNILGIDLPSVEQIIAGYWDGTGYDNFLVSHKYGDKSAPANGASSDPDVSLDGRYISFASDATDLVDGNVGNGGGYNQIYVYDVNTGEIRLMSVNNNGEEGNNDSEGPKVGSADIANGQGLIVIYSSKADNLVTGWAPVSEGGHQAYISLGTLTPTPSTTSTTNSNSFNSGYSAQVTTSTNDEKDNRKLYDAKFLSSTIPTTLKPGETFTGTITIKNTGKMAWTAGTYVFGLQPFGDAIGFGIGNIIIPQGITIEPGQEYSFPITFTVPQTVGQYDLQFNMFFEITSKTGNSSLISFGDPIAINVDVSANGKKTESLKLKPSIRNKVPEETTTSVRTLVPVTPTITQKTNAVWKPTPYQRPSPVKR